jgi:hypothetical protein
MDPFSGNPLADFIGSSNGRRVISAPCDHALYPASGRAKELIKKVNPRVMNKRK